MTTTPTREFLANTGADALSLMIAVVSDAANASVARNRCLEQATRRHHRDDRRRHRAATELARARSATVSSRILRWAASAARTGCAAASCRRDQRPGTVGRVQWWGRRMGNHHLGAIAPVEVEWLKGANMSFRREAFAIGRLSR